MAMTATSAGNKLKTAYQNAGGVTALPWATIIELLLSLFGDCTTAQAQQVAKKHPLAVELMFGNKLLTDMPSLKPKDRRLIAGLAVKEFAKAKASDIDGMR